MNEVLLNVLFALMALVFQFGVTFIVLLGACLLLDKLGMLPKTEAEQQAMMVGFIIGSVAAKPDDKPPSD
jgi:hypothetical protein